MTTYDLFSQQPFSVVDTDGSAILYPDALDAELADNYFVDLLAHPDWESDKLVMFGKPIVTKRKVLWVGDKPFLYRYAGSTKRAIAWPKSVLEIKNKIEALTQHTFNSCLLNLYHSGDESMGWHCDNEPELKKNGMIASVSLGAQRKFSFKHKKTKKAQSVMLNHGSLLAMSGEIQTHWLHQLPATKKVHTARINLTFRTIV